VPDLNEVYKRAFPAESQGDRGCIWQEIAHYLERWIDSLAPHPLRFAPAWWLFGRLTLHVAEARG